VSPLETALAEYLGLRRAFGYHLDDAERYLTRFVAHLDTNSLDTVTINVAVGWAGSAKSASTAADRLTAIRGFTRYLQAIDPRHEVPPCGLIRATTTRPVPHLYSDTDIATLMTAARTLRPGVWAATMETIIGMLWATGMRVGEILRLNTDDLDPDTGLLTVWLTKFGKSRLVPLSSSTCTALDRYRHQVAVTANTNAMFVAANGTRATYRRFNIDFGRLLDASEIATAAGVRPRAHDLRHSFAVRTLLGWYRDGADVQALLPRLSTYLGHVEPASTYWYLSAAPS
jgi:site-specific recombinase XerD